MVSRTKQFLQSKLEPVLTEMPTEVIARGSNVLMEITAQVDAILKSETTMKKAAEDMANTSSGQWKRINDISQNTLQLFQKQFASVFGTSIVETVKRFHDFLV